MDLGSGGQNTILVATLFSFPGERRLRGGGREWTSENPFIRAEHRSEVKPAFRTPPTRYVHSPAFAKDQTYSLFDALDPAATRVFIEGVHERYRQALQEAA